MTSLLTLIWGVVFLLVFLYNYRKRGTLNKADTHLFWVPPTCFLQNRLGNRVWGVLYRVGICCNSAKNQRLPPRLERPLIFWAKTRLFVSNCFPNLCQVWESFSRLSRLEFVKSRSLGSRRIQTPFRPLFFFDLSVICAN